VEPTTHPVMIATVNPTEGAPEPQTADARVEQLKTMVSASRLSLYLSCRLKYFFRYVLQLQKPKTAALHVGSSVHAALKAWNKARWREQPLTLKQLHDEFSKAWSDQGQPVEWDGEEQAEQSTAWKLIEIYTRQANPAAKPDFVEVPVEADLTSEGLPVLIGILDLVQGGVIVDYKTSGQTPNPERVAHTTEVQTSIYSLLYRHNTGKEEQGVELHHLVKTKNPKVVITQLPPMTEQKQSRLFSLMESYVEGLDRRDFVPSPGMQCASCEFFNECKAWH
jgi:CRISPR/Cas system-associated exonuclease Cas4 (RecB family)